MARRVKKKEIEPVKTEVTEKIVPLKESRTVLNEVNEGKTETNRDAIKDDSNYNWDKHSIESPVSAPIIDPQQGKERLLRRFVICTPPQSTATKEEVLEHHKREMLDDLASKGWEPIKEPLVEVLRKRDVSDIKLPAFATDMHIFAIYWLCQIGYGIARYADTPIFNATDALRANKRKEK